MSVRLLTRCLAPAALLAAGLLAPGLARPADLPCPSRHAKAKLVPAVYNVADLVIPVDKTPRVINVGAGAASCEPAGPRPAPTTLETQLIQLITSAIAPRTWSENGGSGTIDYHPLTMSLIVNQTAAVQGQVRDLLAALRRMQDQEVSVEVRFVSVGEDFCERIGVDFNSNPPTTYSSPAPPVAPKQGVAFLNDAQMRKLMEAVQGDQRANVMQAPKLTVSNGQASVIRIGDEHRFVTGVDVSDEGGQVMARPHTETITTGLQMGVRPVISADRRFVRLDLAVNKSELAANVPLFPVVLPLKPADGGEPVVFTQYIQQPSVVAQTMQQTVTVPDGGTVLLGGLKTVREVRNEYGPPVLSKVPYVNRLFKNVGYGRETEHVLVMVTPRVIVHEEEEAKPTHACPCPCPCDPPCACPCPSKCAAKAECCEAHATCCAARHNAVKSKVDELMKRFNELFKEGRYKEAEVYAAVALELDPDNGAASAAVHMARAHARHHSAKANDGETEVSENVAATESAPEVKDRAVADLLRKYHAACAKARKLAERALTLDPTCFSKEKGGDEQSDKPGEQ
jgi:hypothetical protein